MAREYKVRGYPTFVLLDTSGQVIDRWVGYAKDHFISTLNQALADMLPISQKVSRFEAKPSVSDAQTLGRFSQANEDFEAALAYFRRAQTLNTDRSKSYRYEIFECVIGGVRAGKFPLTHAFIAADSLLADTAIRPSQIAAMAASMVEVGRASGMTSELRKYLEAGLAASGDKDVPQRLRDQIVIEHMLLVRADTAAAVKAKKKSMPENWQNDPALLNSFAWWCFENRVNLREAEKFARRGVSLAKPGREKAMIADTAAEICFALGKRREALKFAALAQKEDPENEYYARQLKRFQSPRGH